MKNIKLIIAASLAVLALASCGTKNVDDRANVKPSAAPTATPGMMDKAENAADKAADRTGNAADDIGKAAGDVARDAGDAVGDAAEGVGDAADDIMRGAGDAADMNNANNNNNQ